MKKTYLQIREQIVALERQAQDLKRKEIAGVVGRIKEAIATYGLTAADLGLGAGSASRKALTRKPGPKAAGKRKARSAASIKYRDQSGNTWVGLGKRPAWVTTALAQGRSLDEFRV